MLVIVGTAGAVVSICGVAAGVVTAVENPIRLESGKTENSAAALSGTSLLVTGPAATASTIALAGGGPAGVCGYADDLTTVA